MTTFAKSGFRSINYNSFRPHYPPSFYKVLLDYVQKDRVESIIDLGCGTGVASFPLLNISDKVVGLDLSPLMIEGANKLKADRLEQMGITDADRISFQVSAVEDFEAPPESFDLITCAECIHWFKDYDAFFASAAKQLRPGGVLAYWYYVDPVVVDFEGPYDTSRSKVEIRDAAMQLYRRFVYEDPQYLGPCWEQPGRGLLQNFLVEVDKHIPYSLYKDVVINKFTPTSDGNTVHKDTDLILERKDITLGDFTNYLSTYSSFHNYRDKTGQDGEFLDLFTSTLEKELGWDREKTKLSLDWYTGYTFLRKR